jgi:hypothetical protein
VVQQDGKEIWFEVRSFSNIYRLTTLEKKTMEQEVVATTEVFANNIRATGHVVIYGINFDIAKSTIQPESAKAIEEVAKLLKTDATLKIVVLEISCSARNDSKHAQPVRRIRAAEAVMAAFSSFIYSYLPVG